jgi:uncharacterized protein
MDISNCKRCGMIFQSMGKNICNSCLEIEEQEFEALRKYLNENPGASISNISQELEMPSAKILRFIREGRIELLSGNGTEELLCSSCGKSIQSGRFCEPCRQKLTQKLHQGSGRESNKGSEQEKKIAFKYLNKG